jgi:hypothetical protein
MTIVDRTNIKKTFLFIIAFLFIFTVNSNAAGICLNCSDENSEGKCECCCNDEENSGDVCCSDKSDQFDHTCYQCEIEPAPLSDDKTGNLNTNIIQNPIPGTLDAVISDDELNNNGNFILNEYPLHNRKILSIITILII